MFLSTLNIEQQQAFLGLARLFVEADGQLASQEKAMLEVMKAEMGLSEDIEFPTDNLPNLLKPFDSKPAKAAALLEIIGLGYSDNDFHPQESILVKSMAEDFNVSEDEILHMENWVLRQIMLVREATQFFEE